MEGPGQVARVRVEHGCVREGSQLLSLIRYYESSLDWPPPSNDRDVAVERCRITSTEVRMFYFSRMAAGVDQYQDGTWHWHKTCVDRYINGCSGGLGMVGQFRTVAERAAGRFRNGL